MVSPETVSAVSVPTLVIAVCAAPVTVAAVPLALPVKFPINVVAFTSPVTEIPPDAVASFAELSWYKVTAPSVTQFI